MGGEGVLELIWMAQGGIEGLGRYLPLNLPPPLPTLPSPHLQMVGLTMAV